MGEQDAVAAPQLAVLLEEAVGGRRRAEDASTGSSAIAAAAAGARKCTVRSIVGAATGRVSRGSGDGHQASANIARAGASSGWGSAKRSQPPVTDSSAPA